MGNVFSMYRMYSLYELARTRARENDALFGSREERAGEAGLSLLALLTLILVFSGKLVGWATVKYLVVPGEHPPRK